MNLSQIQDKIKSLVKTANDLNFIYSLLEIYNLPKASITRLKKGNLNLSKNPNEIIWKKKLFFSEVHERDLHETITEIQKSHKHHSVIAMIKESRVFFS